MLSSDFLLFFRRGCTVSNFTLFDLTCAVRRICETTIYIYVFIQLRTCSYPCTEEVSLCHHRVHRVQSNRDVFLERFLRTWLPHTNTRCFEAEWHVFRPARCFEASVLRPRGCCARKHGAFEAERLAHTENTVFSRPRELEAPKFESKLGIRARRSSTRTKKYIYVYIYMLV